MQWYCGLFAAVTGGQTPISRLVWKHQSDRLLRLLSLGGVACAGRGSLALCHTYHHTSTPRQLRGGGVDRRRAVSYWYRIFAHISAATALRLLNVVKDKGKAIVCQGKAEDMKMMAGLFGEVGMKTTVAAGSAPYK